MKNTYFNEVLISKALTFKLATDNQDLLEYGLQNSDLPMKQVCAKLSQSLVDELDSVCTTLDITKRQFIEMALINAIDEFNQIADEYNIFEAYEGQGV
jgi:hypothetical protein